MYKSTEIVLHLWIIANEVELKHLQGLGIGQRAQLQVSDLLQHSLKNTGYMDLDPIHPRGGPDGGVDMRCRKDGIDWIACVHFTTQSSEVTIKSIIKKFNDDIEGYDYSQQGLLLCSNKEISNAERDEIRNHFSKRAKIVDLFHLEKFCSHLNSPKYYGIRLEYLDINMTPEENISVNSENLEEIMKLSLPIKEMHEKLLGAVNVPKVVEPLFPVVAQCLPTTLSTIFQNDVQTKRLITCHKCGRGYLAIYPDKNGVWMDDNGNHYVSKEYVHNAKKVTTCPECQHSQAD